MIISVVLRLQIYITNIYITKSLCLFVWIIFYKVRNFASYQYHNMSFGLVIVVIPTAMNNELFLLSDKCLWNTISYGEEVLEIRIDYRTQWDNIYKNMIFRDFTTFSPFSNNRIFHTNRINIVWFQAHWCSLEDVLYLQHKCELKIEPL